MIGFALMGCGRIARRHAQLLSSSVPGAKLIAVCDPQVERAQELGERHAVPWYASLADLMEVHAAQVDVVGVLTESGNHAAHAIEVASYRKHVMVEKPMALTLHDADEMIIACDRAGTKLFVVKQNRLNRPVQFVRRCFEEGRFGKMVLGTVRVRWSRTQDYYDQDPWRGTWAMDGGVLANQASHHIDLLRWFLGEPLSVFARTRTALVDIECEDTGVAIIEFASGAIGVVEATTASRPNDLEGSLSLLGSSGSAVLGGFAVNRLDTLAFADGLNVESEEHSDAPPDVYGFGHSAYLASVVATLASDSPSLVDGLEGRKSLELISAIYESAETGQPVGLRFRQRKGRLGV